MYVCRSIFYSRTDKHSQQWKCFVRVLSATAETNISTTPISKKIVIFQCVNTPVLNLHRSLSACPEQSPDIFMAFHFSMLRKVLSKSLLTRKHARPIICTSVCHQYSSLCQHLSISIIIVIVDCHLEGWKIVAWMESRFSFNAVLKCAASVN